MVIIKRQGSYVKNLNNELGYNSFRPSKLPPNPSLLVSNLLLNNFAYAHHLLGELNGKSSSIPNIDLYKTMYVRKEALLSSQIEGTEASLDDILDPNIDENTNLDKKEVINYIKATNHAKELIKDLPISKRFLKEVHYILLSNTRGNDKLPGEFRKSQNWIGPIGSTIKNATYIPPNVEDMHDALFDLENYIHYDDSLPSLIKIALIHYQFESIHPFLDGNGRIGRLLIELLLKEYGLLNYDTLYISYYLKKNRREYYDRLNVVRQKGHYEKWIIFFLEAIIESSKHAINTIDKLVQLDYNDRKLIEDLNRNNNTLFDLFEYIQEHPIFNIGDASKYINKSYNTTSKAVDILINLGIISQREKQSRNRTFIYTKYLEILRDEN